MMQLSNSSLSSGAALFAACALALGTASLACAQTSTGDIGVYSYVVTSCEISASNMQFGVYDPSGETRAQSTVSMTCSPGTLVRLLMSAGNSTNVNNRQMVSGIQTLEYDLYRDAGYSDPIGTVVGLYGGNEDTFPLDVPIYGDIRPGQLVPQGFYVDTLTATIEY